MFFGGSQFFFRSLYQRLKCIRIFVFSDNRSYDNYDSRNLGPILEIRNYIRFLDYNLYMKRGSLVEKKFLSKNSTAYIFNELEEYNTNVILIEKENCYFLIDTFCGSLFMELVKNDCKKNKPITIINTHFHWDHVWGNHYFSNHDIIAHEKCYQLLEKNWDSQIKKNHKKMFGKIQKHLPNLLFDSKLYYYNCDIEIFYSPGHTEDSISLFDREDKILYVGDNLEKPIVYVENENIELYITTLKNYLRIGFSKIVASHTSEFKCDDLLKTINYLECLKAGKIIEFESEYENKVHKMNLEFISK